MLKSVLLMFFLVTRWDDMTLSAFVTCNSLMIYGWYILKVGQTFDLKAPLLLFEVTSGRKDYFHKNMFVGVNVSDFWLNEAFMVLN